MQRTTMSDEIERMIRGFEDGSLPREEWTHSRHLVMALWYLRRHPTAEATRRIREGIRHFNHVHGNTTGYHETITLAWVALIERFLSSRGPAEPIADQARDLLESRGQKDYLLRFYSRDRLFSDEARHRWLGPDIRPLDSDDEPAPELI